MEILSSPARSSYYQGEHSLRAPPFTHLTMSILRENKYAPFKIYSDQACKSSRKACSCRDPTRVNLLPFQFLSNLELVGCDISTTAWVGLNSVQSVQSLKCIGCLEELQHLLSPFPHMLSVPGQLFPLHSQSSTASHASAETDGQPASAKSCEMQCLCPFCHTWNCMSGTRPTCSLKQQSCMV